MKIQKLNRFLSDLLDIDSFNTIDSSLNGIQIANSGKPIQKIAFAVDACQESIERAAHLSADMLFVHHGLFWGKVKAIEHSHRTRIKTLLDNDIALFACHLPLDAHKTLGNNAVLAQLLELENVNEFGEYKGRNIGLCGSFNTALNLDSILDRLGVDKTECLSILPFGKEQIQTVGIVSGGGIYDVEEAITKGLDLYITGDASHNVYHLCQEEQINMLSCGHYLTEIWGVKTLAKKIHDETDIETVFLDIPTGL